MPAHALISGSLFKKPEQKMSKNGKPFALATVKMRADDNKSEFWRVVSFSETAIDELMRLNEGDHVAVQGLMKAELYAPEGSEPRISLSIVGDTITPLRGRPKQRADNGDRQSSQQYRRPAAAQAANGPDSEFRMKSYGGSSYDPNLNDDLSF